MLDINKRLKQLEKKTINHDKPNFIWIEPKQDKWEIQEQYFKEKNKTTNKYIIVKDYKEYIDNLKYKDIPIIINDIPIKLKEREVKQ